MQRSSTTTMPQHPSGGGGGGGGGSVMGVSGSLKLEPLLAKRHRVNSAQANLQSHPCFQSSLFSDGERAAGSIRVWKDRHPEFDRVSENARKNFKDHQLENVIWAQSVRNTSLLFISIP